MSINDENAKRSAQQVSSEVGNKSVEYRYQNSVIGSDALSKKTSQQTKTLAAGALAQLKKIK